MKRLLLACMLVIALAGVVFGLTWSERYTTWKALTLTQRMEDVAQVELAAITYNGDASLDTIITDCTADLTTLIVDPTGNRDSITKVVNGICRARYRKGAEAATRVLANAERTAIQALANVPVMVGEVEKKLIDVQPGLQHNLDGWTVALMRDSEHYTVVQRKAAATSWLRDSGDRFGNDEKLAKLILSDTEIQAIAVDVLNDNLDKVEGMDAVLMAVTKSYVAGGVTKVDYQALLERVFFTNLARIRFPEEALTDAQKTAIVSALGPVKSMLRELEGQ